MESTQPLDPHARTDDGQGGGVHGEAAQDGASASTAPKFTFTRLELAILVAAILGFMVFAVWVAVDEFEKYKSYQDNPIRTYYTGNFPGNYNEFPAFQLTLFPLISPNIAASGCCKIDQDPGTIQNVFNDLLQQQTGPDQKDVILANRRNATNLQADSGGDFFFLTKSNVTWQSFEGSLGAPFYLGTASFPFTFAFHGEEFIGSPRRPHARRFKEGSCFTAQTQRVHCPDEAQLGYGFFQELGITCSNQTEACKNVKIPKNIPLYMTPQMVDADTIWAQWNRTLTFDPTEFVSNAMPGGVYFYGETGFKTIQVSVVQNKLLNQSSSYQFSAVLSDTPLTMGVIEHTLYFDLATDSWMRVNAETSPLTLFGTVTGMFTRMHVAVGLCLAFFTAAPRVPWHFAYGKEAIKYKESIFRNAIEGRSSARELHAHWV